MLVLKNFLCGFIIMGIGGLGTSSAVHAHPFHTSTAEMEYNLKTGRFEVALKVPASDLEDALTRQGAVAAEPKSLGAGSPAAEASRGFKRVTLDGTPEVERLIIAYVKARFFLTLESQDGTDRGLTPPSSNTTPDEARAGAEANAQRPTLSDTRSSLNWIGMELDKSSAWLYFELEPPAGDKLSLVNRLFMELNAQQINTCTLRIASTKFSLRTDARQPQVALPPQARLR